MKALASSCNSCRGFTLVEVMVALVIVAVALPALLLQMSTMANSAFHAQQSMLAHWVAENKMQEVQLARALPTRITPSGRTAGDIDMADSRWDWVVEEEPIKDFPGFHRVRVSISPQGEGVLAEITGFMYVQ